MKRPHRGYEKEYVKKAKQLNIMYITPYEKLNGYMSGKSPKAVVRYFGRIKKCTCGGDPKVVQIYDISDVTSDGWSGRKKLFSVFESMLAMKFSKEEIERAIIVFDVADKIMHPRYSSGGSDVNTELQGEMLSLVEGTDVKVRMPGENSGEIMINTGNIIFVFLGAFEDLYKEREAASRSAGFVSPATAEEKEDENEDNELLRFQPDFTVNELTKYGLRTELAGRITSVVTLDKMTEDDYYNILRSEKEANPVKMVEKRFGRKLDLTDRQLHLIAKEASETKTGVRRVNSIMQNIVNEKIFESSCLIEDRLVYNDIKPEEE